MFLLFWSRSMFCYWTISQVLFCSTDIGRKSFVRQLEADWHIDTNLEIISQLSVSSLLWYSYPIPEKKIRFLFCWHVDEPIPNSDSSDSNFIFRKSILGKYHEMWVHRQVWNASFHNLKLQTGTGIGTSCFLLPFFAFSFPLILP